MEDESSLVALTVKIQMCQSVLLGIVLVAAFATVVGIIFLAAISA
jgi:hypothetical protein